MNEDLNNTIAGLTDKYLSNFSVMYPSIQNWFRGKVIQDVKGGRRIIFLAVYQGNAAAIAIAKRGSSTKLCSLHINESLRNSGIGSLLLSNVYSYARATRSQSLHFTMSEEIDGRLAPYFQKRNFSKVGWISGRYRKTIDEFV